VHPRTGGRIVLDLAEASAARVRYHADVYTPGARYQGAATVEGGAVEVSWQDAPPAWLADHVKKFLRTEWRARQGEDPEPWPARISRWRSPPG
jgi:catalase (peroxidase I)